MLQLLRASAGSGKTYRLTQHYIQRLFDDRQSGAHRRILAVTFTNKATDEMKLRIVDELDRLARGASSHFRDELMQSHALNAQQVNQRAEILLKEILHDYSFFAVSTIDRFFQQVLRNFAREIGLHGGYSIEIETEEILDKAIDDLLSRLDSKEDKQLFDWLMRLTTNQIEEGKKWNLKYQLRILAQELFKENFKKKFPLIREKLLDKTFLETYQTTLLKITSVFEHQLVQEASHALHLIESHGLTLSDFKGQSRSPFAVLLKFVRKEISFPSAPFFKLHNQLDEWSTRTSTQKEQIEIAYHAGLNDSIGVISQLFETSYRTYATAKTILKQIYALGILMDIDEQIRLESDETHRLLISDTTELLAKIVDGSDTPFVFEKIGVNIHHLLLDEFQDTSDLQWLNFRPLLLNSLASGNENLVVGDVKQSIYRWRNSNWELLDKQLLIDVGAERIQEVYLNDNWRSGRAIVQFNNMFFSTASDLLQQQVRDLIPANMVNDERIMPLYDKITHAYDKVTQHSPDIVGEGSVTIQFIDEQGKSYREAVLLRLVEWIEKWQDAGYEPGDMAVLVRRNVEATEIVDYLLRYQNSDKAKAGYSYEVISDEALVIGNAQSVQLLVFLMQYILHPGDAMLRAKIAMLFYQMSDEVASGNEVAAYFLPSKEQCLPFETFEQEVWHCVNEGRNGSLFEMTESLIRLLPLSHVKTDAVFLQAFQDWVHHFSLSESMGIDAFLAWWEDKGFRKRVPSPESSHAIRVMTIHKSKGLGFKVVAFPFTDWKLDKQQAMLWCEPNSKPFDELPLVPINYNSKLLDTIFVSDYLEEKTATLIDSLNVAYVAMTRAKEVLLTFAPCPKKTEKEITTFSSLLYHCITQEYEGDSSQGNVSAVSLSSAWNEQQLRLELGSFQQTKKEVIQKNKVIYSYGEPAAQKRVLDVRFHSKDFWEQKTTDVPSHLNYGLLMHDVLRHIRNFNDGNQVVADLERIGRITQEEKVEVERMLADFWTIPETGDWFAPSLKSLNEVAIFTPDGDSYVPDRVVFDTENVLVIDYKFGAPHPQHHRQVLHYKQLIEQMGFTVAAYLCYVPNKQVVCLTASSS
jgi:ATP-dependent exoDNAse (exonuclease V) beta subunit